MIPRGEVGLIFANLGLGLTLHGVPVIDDVLGLVILAALGSVIAAADVGRGLSYGGMAALLFQAVAFLVGALAAGALLSPRLFALAGRLRGQGALLTTALVFCFLLAYLASAVGLAPIVGAYAAGLVLEEEHSHKLEELVRPIGTLLVPVFFVVMGTRVRLEAFAHPEILGLAALLTVAAIVGGVRPRRAGRAVEPPRDRSRHDPPG